MFVYCYFGKIATESYAKMSDCLFESNWPEKPVKLQKYFILMIGNAQRPLEYHGFGLAVLKLETFANVNEASKNQLNNFPNLCFNFFVCVFQMLRNTVTYYMMIKTLTTK